MHVAQWLSVRNMESICSVHSPPLLASLAFGQITLGNA